jgi:hypothetical protein
MRKGSRNKEGEQERGMGDTLSDLLHVTQKLQQE